MVGSGSTVTLLALACRELVALRSGETGKDSTVSSSISSSSETWIKIIAM